MDLCYLSYFSVSGICRFIYFTNCEKFSHYFSSSVFPFRDAGGMNVDFYCPISSRGCILFNSTFYLMFHLGIFYVSVLTISCHLCTTIEQTQWGLFFFFSVIVYFSFIISFLFLLLLCLCSDFKFFFIYFKKLAISCWNFVIVAALKPLLDNSTIWFFLMLMSVLFSHSSCDFYVSWNDRYLKHFILCILPVMLGDSGSYLSLLFQQSSQPV